MKQLGNPVIEFVRPCWNLAQPGMADLIRKEVAGQEVLDLGGMDGMLGQYLVEVCGAKHVTVVEKEFRFKLARERHPIRGVDFFWGYLEDFNKHRIMGAKKWSVTVCSWPINHQHFCCDAIDTMRRSGTVIIIGKNDGATACGTGVLWRYLVQRERIALFEDPRNDIIIYGVNARPEGQELAPIEKFGLSYDNA